MPPSEKIDYWIGELHRLGYFGAADAPTLVAALEQWSRRELLNTSLKCREGSRPAWVRMQWTYGSPTGDLSVSLEWGDGQRLTVLGVVDGTLLRALAAGFERWRSTHGS